MIEQASIVREKRKTIKIVVNKLGNLTVYCPYGLSLNKVDEVLKSKERTISSKIANAKLLSKNYADVMSKKSILLFGKEYKLAFSQKIKKPSFSDKYFFVPEKYLTSNKIDLCIKKVVKEIASRVIPARLKEIAQANNAYVSKVYIGDFHAKWGSCDSNCLIKFNWRLAMLNQSIIDFVIYHEITHLKEMNHSKKFYYELEKICPNWKTSRELLKNYNFLLTMY